jgi:hypothetical protein
MACKLLSAWGMISSNFVAQVRTGTVVANAAPVRYFATRASIPVRVRIISAPLTRSPARIRASNFWRSSSDVTVDDSSVRVRQPTLPDISGRSPYRRATRMVLQTSLASWRSNLSRAARPKRLLFRVASRNAANLRPSSIFFSTMRLFAAAVASLSAVIRSSLLGAFGGSGCGGVRMRRSYASISAQAQVRPLSRKSIQALSFVKTRSNGI